ncbi:MAG: biotin--acetyl-CoA-carboxylase ligase [Alcanivorax sp.]|nr:biotin--acetyl-CoA-carboxylase ligase [Alcanivorax sp.]MBM1142989.1 FxsA family protein [Alcanivorax sp. ZXX171]MAY10627.1 biotin--acetyl-CoA-carboxylase ligase [Alcanivorax sp.]MBI53501.1 biotin--acetyl-CoA-carboxylase ligase [Alcanivorax sp.]MBU60619.1 biotin--acetyl-CoA-carboxylase ligase [Alcanivorax sp.]|tara:strand:- start:26165 stop:26722 length:558 start_codon:yes stop_codon:yes gene_type:complete
MGFGRVFLTILIFALVEVMVLAAVADVIGWPVTIVAVVTTALIGSVLFRRQGLDTWVRLNERMNRGEMPGRELVEGMMLLLGGAFLITPGFITDALGFVLLLPFTRRALAERLIRRGAVQAFASRGGNGGVFFYQSTQWRGGPGGGNVYDGDASVDREPANDGDQRRRPLTLDENEEDSGRDGPR